MDKYILFWVYQDRNDAPLHYHESARDAAML